MGNKVKTGFNNWYQFLPKLSVKPTTIQIRRNINTPTPKSVSFDNNKSITYNLPEIEVNQYDNPETAPLTSKDVKDKELLTSNINEAQETAGKTGAAIGAGLTATAASIPLLMGAPSWVSILNGAKNLFTPGSAFWINPLTQQVASSTLGGTVVDTAMNTITGKTWGQNVSNAINDTFGWNPEDSWYGPMLTEMTNPGYFTPYKIVNNGINLLGKTISNTGRFMASNHTGKWTRFGNSYYRIKPGYLGVNGTPVERIPVQYGYDRDAVAKAATEEFSDNLRRPLLIRAANENNTLADAIEKVMAGESETKFGTGVRTLIEPEPHSVLTGTYYDLTRGPKVRGVGYVSSKPVSVTPTSGVYASSGRFGNMASVTSSLEGAGKYGFRNWEELDNYIKSLNLNDNQSNYILDIVKRMKEFEKGIKFGPETTDGLIPDKLRKSPEYLQYLLDNVELNDWLMGNMTKGVKNQRVVFDAPLTRQIIVGQSDNPGFATRNANIKMELRDLGGKGNRFRYYKDTKIPEEFWGNGMQPETQFSIYNNNKKLQNEISLRHPGIIFPLHFRGIGPNPFPGMTTMQVKGIYPTFKEGGKTIKLISKKSN